MDSQTPKHLPRRGQTVAFQYDMVDRGRRFEEKGRWTLTTGLLIVSLEFAVGLLFYKHPCKTPLPYWCFGRFAGGVLLRGTIAAILWRRGRVMEDKKRVADAVHEARKDGDGLENHGIVISRNFQSPFVKLLIIGNICWLAIGLVFVFQTGCMESAWSGKCDTCNDVFVEVISLFLIVDIIYNSISYPFFWSGHLAGETSAATSTYSQVMQ